MVNGNRWVGPASLLLWIGAIFSVAGASAQLGQPEAWTSELHADHPLVGRIWDSAAGEFIDSESLSERIGGARYILLGEKHDNPDHHALQLATLEYLQRNVRLAAVSFEMLDSEQQPRLDDLAQRGFGETETLGQLKDFLNWDDSGWDWEFYGPLLASVQRAGTPLRAGNISAETVSAVYAEPLAAEITAVLDEKTLDQLNKDIDESHCGLLPASQFPAMVRVQQARDASLAASLPELAADEVGVLVAGNYHVRQDLGVPRYLASRDEDISLDDILVLSFAEVSTGETDPEAYQQRFIAQAAFDYIWFTPAISDEDYCDSLRPQ